MNVSFKHESLGDVKFTYAYIEYNMLELSLLCV